MKKKHFTRAIGMTLALSLPTLAMAEGDASQLNDADAALVDNLQGMETALRQQMPGLSPDEIGIMRKIYNEQEAARQNPEPPKVTNRVNVLNRGESPEIDIMERFDTTLVFADRHGTPLEITAFRISDDEAATLVPLHGYDDKTPIVETENDEELLLPSSDGEGGEGGPIIGVVVTPNSTMRSTNITVMLRGQDFPIVATLTTRSSLDTEHELAFIQEMRLSWTSSMPRAEELAGKFTGSNGGGALSQRMVSLVQGIPDSALDPVPLRGEMARQVTLWHDKEDEQWYLRLAEHIEPWNISIDERTRDGLRGFTVIRLKGAPPSLIGLSVNGQYQTVEIES